MLKAPWPFALLTLLLPLVSIAQESAADRPRAVALLVGVTQYENLSRRQWLNGGANDVRLLKGVLERRHFDEIVVLSDDPQAKARPTRDNIGGEVRRIIERVGARDVVVLYFAGHGSIQPTPEASPAQAAQDLVGAPRVERRRGYQAIFLPRDVGAWDGAVEQVARAIPDAEIEAWVKQLLDRGASVWAIFDSCHSGGISRRGVRGAERGRAIQPEDLGVPAGRADAARGAAAKAEPGDKRGAAIRSGYGLPTSSPNFVAMYACRSFEETHELPLEKLTVFDAVDEGAGEASSHAPGQKGEAVYGLFTYRLCNALERLADRRVTFEDLIAAIRRDYHFIGLSAPVPLIEGLAKNREVLGEQRRAQGFAFHGGDPLTVDAGRLHGFGEGTVFAIYSDDIAEREAPVGHVQITEAGTLRSTAVAVAPPGGDPADAEHLPEHGIARTVSIEYGFEALRVFLDQAQHPGLATALAGRQEGSAKLLAFADEPEAADFVLSVANHAWFISEPARGQRWEIAPASGPAAEVEQAVAEALHRIAMTRSLLQTVQQVATGVRPAGQRLDVRLRLYRLQDADDRDPKRIEVGAGGVTLHAGELVGLEIDNRSRQDIDVTILFISSRYEVVAVFPPGATEGENRMPRGARPLRLFDPPITIDATTLGEERFLLIAVPAAEGQPASFAFLAEPTAAGARATATRRDRARTLESPLGRLLTYARYREGSRGDHGADATAFGFDILTWTTANAPASPEPAPR